MPSIVASNKALKIVAGWCGEDAAATDARASQPSELPSARPARLGLGASAEPTKPAGAQAPTDDLATSKLQKSLKKQQRREAREELERAQGRKASTAASGDADAAHSSADSDEEEELGRSAVIAARAPARLDAAAPAVGAQGAVTSKKRKGKSQRTAAAREDESETPAEPARKAASGSPGRAESAAPAADAHPARNSGDDAPGRAGKRRKTRSKQKNIRRDTRPDHLKPTYRTPGAADYVAPARPAW